MYALTCLLEEELHKRMTETYIAEHLWFLTGAIYAMAGSEITTPRYTELIDPSLAKKDIRTADEIRENLINKLG